MDVATGFMCDKESFRNACASVFREELIFHNISKKGVHNKHKAKVYTSF